MSQVLPNIDPPLAFAADGIPLGTHAPGGYAVDDTAIYYLTEDATLVSHELATGRQRLSVSFDTYDDSSPSQPVVSDGRVFVAYQTQVRGTGTQADRFMVRTQALDAKTGKSLWATNLPQKYTSKLDAQFAPAPRIFAADEKHVVVEALFGFDTHTEVLTAEDGKVLWKDPSFVPVAFDGQVLVGQAARAQESGVPPEGRAVADGSRLWKLPARPPTGKTRTSWGLIGGVHEAGSTRQTYFAADLAEVSMADPPPHVLLYRVADGERFVELDGEIRRASQPNDCRHDGRRTIVCGTDRVVVAYDARSGKRLWRLPDKAGHRVAPEVMAVWHGIVYGRTDNGAMALDARTGQDKVTDLAITPEYVGRGFGIAPKGESGDDQLELYLHPATD
ncbi:PQQ-binding-like beta-propeller repeat protein [Streptomyces coelicoflavus]|uniref:outer membrane protein assembly factor BamB family protein n=1 Tax=Streptomyces coelicoflavus TaxID=285562 RepID=UPI0036C1AD77